MSVLERDDNGVLHIVGLSGGDDSTLMSLLLKEREPRPYNYLCTPTGNELPEMFEHWRWLGSDNALGKRILPIMAGTLASVIREEKMLPNFRARFCTRRLKIEPYEAFLAEQVRCGPVVSYVGLRADEEVRQGGIYNTARPSSKASPLRMSSAPRSERQVGTATRAAYATWPISSRQAASPLSVCTG